MPRFPDHFGVRLDPFPGLDIKDYIEKFGFPVILEHDHRFNSLESLRPMASQEGFELNSSALYSNFLGDTMDQIYHYEELGGAVIELSERFNLNPLNFPKLMQRDTRDSIVVGDEMRALIAKLHYKDRCAVQRRVKNP
jgi:hypothetical protein